MGGLIAKVLQFARETVEGKQTPTTYGDAGGGNNITGESYGPAGVDAPPLESDYVAFLPVQGGFVAVGYMDPENAGTANPGEFRAVGRDSGGAVKGYILIDNTGKMTVNGHLTVEPA